MPSTPPAAFPLDKAGLCVACGLCLPHCPTYRVTRDESESPRGRISLMRALAAAGLEPTPRLVAHLDHCVACRACERACPSEVPYGELIDSVRAQLTKQGHLRLSPLADVLTRRAPRRLLGWLLFLYQRSGLARLLHPVIRHGRSATALAALPRVPRPIAWQPLYSARAPRRGDVALFTGCATDLIEQDLLRAAIGLLNALGYDVHVPRDQSCCGALHQHHGAPASAQAHVAANQAAFADPRFQAVLSVASGCSAMLRECDRDIAGTRSLRARTEDICAFIDRCEWPAKLRPAPLPGRIAVHDACQLRNVLRAEAVPYRLLARIPGTEIVPLAENHICCGAGGGYFLEHAALATPMRDDKVAHIRTAAPAIVATTNTGCAMQLRAGLHRAGLAIEVTHPVVLLARQLGLSA